MQPGEGTPTRIRLTTYGAFVHRDQQISASGMHALRAACLAVLMFPAVLSAEEVNNRAYRLAPGDRVTVTVFGQPDLSGDVLIDDAGTISIPLAAPIEVKDLTVSECQKRIGERLLADGILRTPSVGVRIAELRPLYVMGDVRLPGAYPFRYGSTTQSAVALAGGFGPGEVLRHTAIRAFCRSSAISCAAPAPTNCRNSGTSYAAI